MTLGENGLTNECTPYEGSICQTWGYGRQKVKGKYVGAHRIAYCEANGLALEDIAGLVVRHTCDNPPCVNPAHLIIGTHAENVQDKVLRNRQAKGVDNGRAILTEEQVTYCRGVFVRGSKDFGTAALARQFNVSQRAMYSAIHYGWRHLDD